MTRIIIDIPECTIPFSEEAEIIHKIFNVIPDKYFRHGRINIMVIGNISSGKSNLLSSKNNE